MPTSREDHAVTTTQPRYRVFKGRVGMTTVRRDYTMMDEPRAAGRRSRSSQPPGENAQFSIVERIDHRHAGPQRHSSYQILLTATRIYSTTTSRSSSSARLGDVPTRGLDCQPCKHMSVSIGEKPRTGSAEASMHTMGPCDARYNARRSSRLHVAQLTLH